MTTALQSTAVVIQLPVFSKEIAIQSAWLEKRNAAVAEALAVVKVESPTDYDTATEALAKVSKLDSGIEKMRKELTAPFLAAQRTIKEKVDEACVPLQEQKERLKKLTDAYQAAERKRIAAETAERELRDRENAEEALALAEEARQQAEALGIDAPAAVDLVAVVTPVEDAPKSVNASCQTRIDAEIVDETKVPRAFCVADIRLINSYKKENKAELEKRIDAGEGETIIAGVKFTLRFDVMGR